MSNIQKEDLLRLSAFIEACKENPSLLWLPDLKFFKEYIESFGGVIPESTNTGSSTGEKESPQAETQSKETAPPPAEAEMSSEESDVEIDAEGVIDPESIDLPEMGDPSKMVSEEDEEMASNKRSEAMGIMSEDMDKAVELLTEAIKLNPNSAAMYAKRANLLLKQKRVKAALADCDKAIEINQDYASAYKFRGRANRLLGNWIEAAKDLRTACKLDFDEQADEWLKEVQPKASRIEEHNRKYERKREEKKVKEARERVRKAQEARKKEEEKRSQEMPNFGDMPGMGGMGGMPGMGGLGGMPGMGGMEALFAGLMDDPEVKEALKDPEVSAAFMQILKNPGDIAKYKDNPKVAKLLEKFSNSLNAGGFSGGMPGMAGGFPGGMPGGFPGSMPGGPGDSTSNSGPQPQDDLD